MHVVILAVEDFGNVGRHLAGALETAGHTACLVRERPHPFDYDAGGRLAGPGRVLPQHEVEAVQAELDAADVLIWKDDRTPCDLPALELPHVPMICTAEGTGFRRDPMLFSLQAGLQGADVIVPLTADLFWRHITREWIPQPYPFTGPVWDGPPAVPLLFHAVGHNWSIKGTDSVWKPALQLLADRGQVFREQTLFCLPWPQVIHARRQASIVFDQADEQIGAWGMAAVESMAAGVPLICYLSESARDAAGDLLDGCPLVLLERPEPDCLADAMQQLLQRDLVAYSADVFGWAQGVHGYDAVGRRWSDLLESIV